MYFFRYTNLPTFGVQFLILSINHSFANNATKNIRQRCPTLSPFATCGDRKFKWNILKVVMKSHLKAIHRVFKVNYFGS